MSDLAQLARRNRNVLAAWIVVVVLMVAGTLMATDFASPSHVRSMLIAASFVGLIGVGQTLCILTGGIDLSIPAVVAGSAVLVSQRTYSSWAELLPWMLLILGLALIIGLINGLAVAYAKVPPIIMTLGMNGAVAGLLLVVTSGGTTAETPEQLGPMITETYFGLAPVIWIWIIVTIVVTLVLARTSFGRSLYAVGANANAAGLAGLRVSRITVVPYVVSAVMAALAGFLLLGYLGQAYVTMGDGYLFSSAIAVAVGGASILGGRGNYLGTVAGALVLTLIAAILPIFSLGTGAVRICSGLILLIAVSFGSRAART